MSASDSGQRWRAWLCQHVQYAVCYASQTEKVAGLLSRLTPVFAAAGLAETALHALQRDYCQKERKKGKDS